MYSFGSLSLRLHAHEPLAERMMHMHKKLETLQKFLSRHRIGSIIQAFREMCVMRSLMVCLKTNMP